MTVHSGRPATFSTAEGDGSGRRPRGEKILLLAYARSCQHMGESETAINAAPRAVSELRKSNFIPRELSSFLKESVKTRDAEPEPEPEPEPPEPTHFGRSRSRSRSRRNGLLGAGAGAGAVKNVAAPAPKMDKITEK